MRKVFLGVSVLLIIFLSSCSDQPTSFSNTQKMDGTLSKISGSEYIPGTDITDELRADLNAGLNVNLPAGEFLVSESIVVEGYSGTLKGAGKDATIIKAAQGFKPLPNPQFPGDYEVAEIFDIYRVNGDVTFKDLTILVTGDAPALKHNNPFVNWVTTIDNAIVVSITDPEVESGVTVTFKNLKIKGNDSEDPDSYNGKNLIYPIIVSGWGGANPINEIVKDCEIENAGSAAIEFFAANGGFTEIKNNVISNSYMGIWLGWGLADCEVIVKDNRFNNITSTAIFKNWWDVYSCCIKNNILDGAPLPDDCQ